MRHSKLAYRGIGPLLLGLLGALALGRLAVAAGPLAVVRVSPLQDCRADLKAVQEVLSGEDCAATRALAFLIEKSETLGKNGLDETRPLGVAVLPVDGRPLPVAFVPTTDLFALYEASKNWLGEVEEKGNDIVKVKFLGRDLYAKAVAGWVYVGTKEAALENVPASPEPWLEGLDPQWDVIVRVDVPAVLDAVGPRLRNFVEKLEARAGEEESRHPLAATLARQVLPVARRAVLQTREIQIGYQVDRESQKLKGMWRWTARPDTDLARYFAGQQYVTSPLAALRRWPDTPLTVAWTNTFPVPPEEALENLGKAFQTGFSRWVERRIHNASDAELARSLFDQWLRLAGEWVRQGRSEGVMLLVAKPDQVTLLGGKFVGNSEGVEEFVGRLVDVARQRFPKLFEKIQVSPNFDRRGDADIHLMTVDWSDKLTPEQKALLGEKLEIAFTAANGYSGVAIGKNAVATLKRAIDDCVAEGEQPCAPFEMRVGVEKLTAVCAQINPNRQKVQKILDFLRESPAEEAITARVRTGGDSAECTWEADLRLIRIPRVAR